MRFRFRADGIFTFFAHFRSMKSFSYSQFCTMLTTLRLCFVVVGDQDSGSVPAYAMMSHALMSVISLSPANRLKRAKRPS
jgi:hypothetical protein